MAIYETAYDTVACSGYRTQDIEDKINLARIQGTLINQTYRPVNIDYVVSLSLVTGGVKANDLIPYFSHPFCLRDSKDGSMVVYADVRNYGRFEPHQAQFTVRNQVEYDWCLKRAVLNYQWKSERPELFRDISTLPAAIYGTLISQTVARKYALDPGEQITLMALAIYHYYSLFTDEKEFEPTQQLKLVGKIAQIAHLPAESLMTLFEGMGPIHGLQELCEAIKAKVGSVRLNDFNVGVLLAIVSGNWFGTNAREVLAVGLEHIPTWMMICYSSVSEATFKRSTLARMAEQHARGGADVAFARSLEGLIDTKGLQGCLGV
jgi:hypothetical protein